MNKTLETLIAGGLALGITVSGILGLPKKAYSAEVVKENNTFSVKAERNDSYVIENGIEDSESRQKFKTFLNWLMEKMNNYNEKEKLQPFRDYFEKNMEFYNDLKNGPAQIIVERDDKYIKVKTANTETSFNDLAFEPEVIEVSRDEEIGSSPEVDKLMEQAEKNIPPEARKTKGEIKAEKKKAKKEAKLKAAQEKKKENGRQEVSYVIGNDNGARKKYLYDSFDSFFENKVVGNSIEDILNNVSPDVGVFETFDREGRKAYIFDMDNFRRDSAVYVEIDKDKKVKSRNLLLEEDLGKKVAEYLTSQNLVVEKINNVEKNINNLKRKNAREIKNYGDYVIIKQEEGGVVYSVKKDLISRINELDRKTLNRALEKEQEISLGLGSEPSLSYIYCGSGVVPGIRGKFNIIYNSDKNLIKQVQAVLSSTRKTGEKTAGGIAVFQDRIGNWSFSEMDGFFRYLGKNTRVDALTGMTVDKTDFGRTDVSGYILEQSREGKSGLLINVDADFKSPVQIAGIWEKWPGIGIVPSINPSVAYVNGSDAYKFLWLNADGTEVSIPGFKNPSVVTIPSDYTTIALDGKLSFRVDQKKRINLELLAGTENNNFSQLINGEMKNNPFTSSRFGINSGYDTDNLKTNALIISQNNSNVGRANTNGSIIANLQAGYRHKDYAGLLNLYSEGFNNSNMAEVSLMISRYADKYLDHEVALKRMQAMYDARNTNSLLPKGTNNKVWDTPSVYQGASLSFYSGMSKFGETLSGEALKFYAGKGWSSALKHDKKGSEDKYKIEMGKSF